MTDSRNPGRIAPRECAGVFDEYGRRTLRRHRPPARAIQCFQASVIEVKLRGVPVTLLSLGPPEARPVGGVWQCIRCRSRYSALLTNWMRGAAPIVRLR